MTNRRRGEGAAGGQLCPDCRKAEEEHLLIEPRTLNPGLGFSVGGRG